MNWEQWLEANQMNIDFGESSVDLMRRAYIAGLSKALDIMYSSEDGDFDFILWQLENTIKESK